RAPKAPRRQARRRGCIAASVAAESAGTSALGRGRGTRRNMRVFRDSFARAVAATAFMLGTAGLAAAQSPADFYKGRNIDEYIGYSTGGAYDFYARVIGRHMGAHIPGNPTLIPRNMEGAGSLRLANWLYRVAPQDGSAFG